MIYLRDFTFPVDDEEQNFLYSLEKGNMSCFDSVYPFGVLSQKGLHQITFDYPITLFYGSNGCGKTTVLNVIAQKLGLSRKSLYNRTPYFDDYLSLCNFGINDDIPATSNMISSDDIFQQLQSIRRVNKTREIERNKLFDEYNQIKFGDHKEYKSIDFNDDSSVGNYERYRYIMKHSQSSFVKANAQKQIRGYSNGESAMIFLQENIQQDALYILDEPENSMSPLFQRELSNFIEASAIACSCQFIIATHSPFLLSMDRSKIYDMDEETVAVKDWKDLEIIKIYRELFTEPKS